MKKLVIAGCLLASALVGLWLSKRGAPRGVPVALPMEHQLNELPLAYQALARLTALPDSSVDPTGTFLPKEFAAYLADENGGYDRFVAGLSADGLAQFAITRETVGYLGAEGFAESVMKNRSGEKPSAFDFILFTGLGECLAEYPAKDDAAKARIVRCWISLAQSRNPIFRFLAISGVHRVIKDRDISLAILDARTCEIDPVMVYALIDQLTLLGGGAAKAALTRISNDARARNDLAVARAADDALAKLE
jgi:hypothetical protein